MKTILYITYGVLIGLLAGGLIWLALSKPRGEPATLLPTSTPAKLVVYVSGAVMTPGIYSLPTGSRVGDAIQAAGGLATGAETDTVNLAMPLKDGDQISIPGTVNPSHVIASRININTATADELATLPGIGPTTATNIIDYRLQHGPFQSIQDIQNVPGIGPETFAMIENYISITP